MKRFVDQKHLSILLLLQDTVDWVLFTLGSRSKLDRNFEVQNMLIVLFKTPSDVMQISLLTAQLGLRSELIDWYWDTTSVPCSHLLIVVSPRTVDRLRCCTNNGFTPSKFHIPDRLKQPTFLDDELTKFLYAPSVPIIFPQRQKSLTSVLTKRIYPVSVPKHSISSQTKPAKNENTSRDKIWKRSVVSISEKDHVKAKGDFLLSQKGLQFGKINTLHVSLTMCFDMEQFVPVLLLCTTRKQKPSQLQSRNFQSINLYRNPRTKLIHLRRW